MIRIAHHGCGLRILSSELDTTGERGKWLRQAVTGFFNYHTIPTNSWTIVAFRHHVANPSQRTFIRRSQKDGSTWQTMMQLADDWLPKPRVLHPWPYQRFIVRHPGWEPYAGKPHIRIYAGGVEIRVPTTIPAGRETQMADFQAKTWRSSDGREPPSPLPSRQSFRHKSEVINVNDCLRKRVRGFLRHVVSDAAGDEALIIARPHGQPAFKYSMTERANAAGAFCSDLNGAREPAHLMVKLLWDEHQGKRWFDPTLRGAAKVRAH
ncbi:MAG TPA: hypothetical protein VHX61_20555 [Rhizomicrobium sp.]|jgi:hypothetical protein|nr:hypothetical protein [Rhizomicrobium sp.]